MRRLYPLCLRLAASSVPVIIEGETGTGKELLAESLHTQGPRAAGPFVVFDCTAVTPNLAESELFGHERGAFTGAIGTHHGVFEQAHGGTLLLDEIGDLDPALQPKLLRVLQRSEVRRIGAESSMPVDVRILAATRRDLDREVVAGRFRDDLFHRLSVARLELPPLRRRRGDIAILARFFCQELGGGEDALPRPLLAQWEDSPWPGNVRELRNAVARRLTLGDLAPVYEAPAAPGRGPAAAPLAHAPASGLDRFLTTELPFSEARRRLITEFEQRYIAAVLEQHGGNVTRAAAASRLGRRYFQQLRARKP
jgi:transcriptional regulator with GAF, ATPase, and Fis domain